MADESITPTPTGPRPGCPACAGRIATTPGARCEACQAPLTVELPARSGIPSLRLPDSAMPNPGFVGLAVVFLSLFAPMALFTPGLLVPMGTLGTLAAVRAWRMGVLRGEWGGPRRHFLWVASFLSSLGLTLLVALAGAVAGIVVCTGVTGAAGGVLPVYHWIVWVTVGAEILVTAGLYVLLWPRRNKYQDPRPKKERDED